MRLGMRESHFQNYLVQLARLNGWLVHHDRPALSQSGRYMTPIQGHVGFPDLVLVRGHRVIFAELKRDRSCRLSDSQELWFVALSRVPGVEVYVWTPDDIGWIESVLK